ncbi:MAG: glutathione S-transferase family protein [Chrysiogenetes bacterium]|nr:glutathione S-transferase family protein [Chrysiogenetes bacterium]
MASTLELYHWEISPFCEKVRRILDYKGLPYRTITQPLTRRPLLQSRTGQQKVPVLRDGETWVADSTDIARYLEERYPEKPVLPTSGRDRALCLLIEDWADEAFASSVQPAKWLSPGNFSILAGRMREELTGPVNNLLLTVAKPVLQKQMREYLHGRGMKRNATVLTDQLDQLEVLLESQSYLFGDTPTVADFAVAALLKELKGLKGWEIVAAHPRVLALTERIESISSARVA